jgi:hypothetical protein
MEPLLSLFMIFRTKAKEGEEEVLALPRLTG